MMTDTQGGVSPRLSVATKLLPEADVSLYGLRPLEEPLALVCCQHCQKAVKETHFRKHVIICYHLKDEKDKAALLAALPSDQLDVFEEPDVTGQLPSKRHKVALTPDLTTGDADVSALENAEVVVEEEEIMSSGTMLAQDPKNGSSESAADVDPVYSIKELGLPDLLPFYDLQKLALSAIPVNTVRHKMQRLWTHAILFGPSALPPPAVPVSSTPTDRKNRVEQANSLVKKGGLSTDKKTKVQKVVGTKVPSQSLLATTLKKKDKSTKKNPVKSATTKQRGSLATNAPLSTLLPGSQGSQDKIGAKDKKSSAKSAKGDGTTAGRTAATTTKPPLVLTKTSKKPTVSKTTATKSKDKGATAAKATATPKHTIKIQKVQQSAATGKKNQTSAGSAAARSAIAKSAVGKITSKPHTIHGRPVKDITLPLVLTAAGLSVKKT